MIATKTAEQRRASTRLRGTIYDFSGTLIVAAARATAPAANRAPRQPRWSGDAASSAHAAILRKNGAVAAARIGPKPKTSYLPRVFAGPISAGRVSEPDRAGAVFAVSVEGVCSISVLPFPFAAASESFGTVALGLSVPNCAAELLFKSVPS